MNIRHCFEILELDPSASPREIKEAYKDIVNVWHPDRFSNNPRLRLKAEKKLKEINRAYEILNSNLSQDSTGNSQNPGQTTNNRFNKRESKTSKTETLLETGTFLTLSLFYHVTSAIRQATTDMSSAADKDDSAGG